MAISAILRRRRPPSSDPQASSLSCSPLPSPSSSRGAAASVEHDEDHVQTVLSGQAKAPAAARRASPSSWQPPRASAVEEDEALVARLRSLVLGVDRWTALLAALWAMLFLALFVNKQGLWVVLAGLVAYACFCFLLDVVAIPPFWDGPLKAKQTARLSNGLVGIAHTIAMGLAALGGASAILKLTMSAGYLLFDLWDKTWKRLYTSPPYRYTRGIPYAMQGATVLVLSITAICKGVPLNPDLLVGVPAIHLLFESIHDLVSLFALEDSGVLLTAKIAEVAFLFPTRLLPHAALLASHLLTILSAAPEATQGVMGTWWATRVMTTLLVMLNASNVASLFWPAFLRQRILAHYQRKLAKQQDDDEPSALWYVHGKAYQLEAFMSKHPGGAHALSLGQGRDCTALFESYHPFTERHRAVLGKYEVEVPASVLDQYVVKRDAAPSEKKEKEEKEGEGDLFYETLKARVGQVLAGTDVVASWKRRLYYVAILLTVGTSYLGFLRGSWAALFVFSLASWLMGAMGHDGSHFACSHRPWVNQLCGLGISLIASPFLWYHQHTFAHHSFTNDFEVRKERKQGRSFFHPPTHSPTPLPLQTKTARPGPPPLRPDPPPRAPTTRAPALPPAVQGLRPCPVRRGRLWYVVLPSTFLHPSHPPISSTYPPTHPPLGETVWIPLKLVLFRTLHGMMAFPNMGFKGVATALFHFALYCYLVFYLPTHCLAGMGVKVWAFPLIYVSICGLLFGVFSQINHLNEGSIESAGQGGTSWAREQVETSANFATDSTFWFVLSNGLNYQIEHHLFPGVNHEHLWRISPVVKATCREFGVRYKSYESMAAIAKETAAYYRSLAHPAATTALVQ